MNLRTHLQTLGGAAAAIAFGAGLTMGSAAHATTFTDQTAFDAAVGAAGITLNTDNFSAYAQQNIAVGQTLGSFKYTFDPNLQHDAGTLPTIGTDGGVNVLVGGPNSQGFVGGNSVTLSVTGGKKLLAFGAVFTYAPNFAGLLAGFYNLTINDGTAANTNAASPAGLTGAGGSFFLGFIGDPGQDFSAATLSSLLQAPDGSFVPAYEIDELDFGSPQVAAAAVPEPASGGLVAAALGALVLIRRRARPMAR